MLGVIFFNRGPAVGDLTNYPPQSNQVVAFGDSLISGVGATSGNDFISLLSERLNTKIINLGVPGNTTADGLARLEEVHEQKPGIVLVLFGGNDFLRRVPKEKTFSNLQKIIDSIHDQGSLVLLLGVKGGILADGYDKEFSALAKKNKTAYVPNVLKGILGKANLTADQIHPNDAGYQKIADQVYPILAELLE